MPEKLLRRLGELADPAYRAFYTPLIPTVEPERVLGVRIPDLRKLANELKGTEEGRTFLRALPHRTYEEDNLHGLLLGTLGGYGETVAALEAFLPFVDNWATCDLIRPRCFRTHPAELPGQLHRWLASDHPYTVRFGMEMLMVHYLASPWFRPEYLNWCGAVPFGDYYVNMMSAWYFATALAEQYEAALPWLVEGRLDPWVHNKTIQKAIESRRISPEQKALLRGLRRR